jgi:hypothetical protein
MEEEVTVELVKVYFQMELGPPTHPVNLKHSRFYNTVSSIPRETPQSQANLDGWWL